MTKQMDSGRVPKVREERDMTREVEEAKLRSAMLEAIGCARRATSEVVKDGVLHLELSLGPNIWANVSLPQEAEGALLGALLTRSVFGRQP